METQQPRASLGRFFGFSAACALALGLLSACAQTGGLSGSADSAPEYIRMARQSVDYSVHSTAHSARLDALFVSAPGVLSTEEDAEQNAAAGDKARILRMNPLSLALEAEIALPEPGYGLALDDKAARLYVGLKNAVAMLDAKTGQILKTLELPDSADLHYPLETLVLDAEHQRLWVPAAKTRGSALHVITTRDFTVEKTIPDLGFLVSALAFDHANHRAWVANRQGQIHVLDTQALAVQNVLEIAADEAASLAWDAQHNRLWLADQGTRHEELRRDAGGLDDYQLRSALYGNPRARAPHRGHRLLALDPDNGDILNRFELDNWADPNSLLLHEDRLYIANRNAGGRISSLDLENDKLLDNELAALLPGRPRALSMDAKSQTLFVAIQSGRNDDLRPSAREAEAVGWATIPKTFKSLLQNQ